jgi:hypothetical protein
MQVLIALRHKFSTLDNGQNGKIANGKSAGEKYSLHLTETDMDDEAEESGAVKDVDFKTEQLCLRAIRLYQCLFPMAFESMSLDCSKLVTPSLLQKNDWVQRVSVAIARASLTSHDSDGSNPNLLFFFLRIFFLFFFFVASPLFHQFFFSSFFSLFIEISFQRDSKLLLLLSFVFE